ncbi:MAG: ATPase, partial [Chloroflexi bacterium]|nr:ATPase [Chloroflexota bacterium]
MDIQHLVDRLEELIDEGRHIWFTKMTMIDEERALEIIDQMRISIPEEIEKANRVLNQRDRILAQANEEAARIIDLAREKAETLIQRDAIVQAAQSRAANIIEQARQEAEQMRADADNYVLE